MKRKLKRKAAPKRAPRRRARPAPKAVPQVAAAVSAVDRKRMYMLRADGRQIPDIARRFAVSEAQVSQVLAEPIE